MINTREKQRRGICPRMWGQERLPGAPHGCRNQKNELRRARQRALWGRVYYRQKEAHGSPGKSLVFIITLFPITALKAWVKVVSSPMFPNPVVKSMSLSFLTSLWHLIHSPFLEYVPSLASKPWTPGSLPALWLPVLPCFGCIVAFGRWEPEDSVVGPHSLSSTFTPLLMSSPH